jgi:hypothetical protein
MMFPAKKQIIVEMKADWEGAGMVGGHVKRGSSSDRAEMLACLDLHEGVPVPAYLLSNCIKERVKRKAVIGPHTSGTTYHFVRVKDCHQLKL